MTMDEYFKLFSKLETSSISEEDVLSIANIVDPYDPDNNTYFAFKYYLSQRMRENISDREFLNITQNIFNKFGLRLDYKYYDVLATEYIKGNNYYLNILLTTYHASTVMRYDFIARVLYHVANEFDIEKTAEICFKLEKEINFDINGIFSCLYRRYSSGGNNIKFAQLLDILSNEVKYNLLCYSINSQSDCFPALEDSLAVYDFYSFVENKIISEKSDAKIIQAIIDTKLPVYYFSCCCYLIKILFDHHQLVPDVIYNLYNKCIKDKEWEFLIKFGLVFNKKKILKVLLENGDRNYIDHFFKKYRNDPLIKKLVMYL